MAAWKLTVRSGPKVRRWKFDSAATALDALERQIEELRPSARREELQVFRRSFEAARQVSVRAELAGPDRVRAGLDLRGDGSTEAYTGRLRRTLIKQQRKEDALAALRRTLSED